MHVLTWNVSFGAMTGSDDDRSSIPLPEKCREKYEKDVNGESVTQCLMNVVKTIDESSRSQSYDFVALQEVSNWNIIFSNSVELQRMGGYVHHLADKADMATFYDANKYTLLAVKVGNLLPGNGRPYQILFLQNKQDDSYYIFINLHNGHGILKEILERKLSENINRGVIPSKDSKLDINSSISEVDISDIISSKDFKIIMAGDTNDHNIFNYWRGLQPFKITPFPNINRLEVKSTQPPNTCCAPDSRRILRRAKTDDTEYGDYILFSQNLYVLIDNRVLGFNYDARVFPTSDHLPVESILSTIPIRKDSGDLKYKKKYLKYKQKYLEIKNNISV